MPITGVYQSFCGLREVLDETYYTLTNVDLIYDATSGPIWRILADHQEGMPEYIARERLRQHLEWVEQEFGLYYPPTWEEIRDDKWHCFDGMYEYYMWTLYIEDHKVMEAVEEMLEGEVDPNPSDLAVFILKHVSFLAMSSIDLEDIYVIKSEYVCPGRRTYENRDLGPLNPLADLREGGSEDSFSLPPKIINKAIDIALEHRGSPCLYCSDPPIELEGYRCTIE